MDDLIVQLRRLAAERRPEACLGCGHEHGCSLHGCQVIREAADRLETLEQLDLIHMKHPLWVPYRAIIYFQRLVDQTLGRKTEE